MVEKTKTFLKFIGKNYWRFFTYIEKFLKSWVIRYYTTIRRRWFFIISEVSYSNFLKKNWCYLCKNIRIFSYVLVQLHNNWIPLSCLAPTKLPNAIQHRPNRPVLFETEMFLATTLRYRIVSAILLDPKNVYCNLCLLTKIVLQFCVTNMFLSDLNCPKKCLFLLLWDHV